MPNKPKTPYRLQDLESAIKAVKERGYGVRKAAKIFNVPRSTLHDNTEGKYNGRNTHIGKGRALDDGSEQILVRYVRQGLPSHSSSFTCDSKGFGSKIRPEDTIQCCQGSWKLMIPGFYSPSERAVTERG